MSKHWSPSALDKLREHYRKQPRSSMTVDEVARLLGVSRGHAMKCVGILRHECAVTAHTVYRGRAA